MLGLILLWATAVSGEYMFTLPRTMEASSKTSFCLILKDLEYPGFQPDQGYRVTVNLDYSSTRTTASERHSAMFGIVSEDGDYNSCHQVNAPRESGDHTASVNVTIAYIPEGQSEEVEDTIISASKSLIVSEPELITLIQTDKPIYKPGETVKFRVLTMDYKLTPRTDGYQKITIETPSGLRVMQWNDVSSPAGLVSLEMPLSKDPVLGEWKIKLIYGSKEITQTFKVEEYVLPKFEVTVTPPSYLLPTTRTISGQVCAKYTYGKPVRGQLKMEICYRSEYYYYSYAYSSPRPCANIIAKIDGCYDFYVDAEDIKLGHRRFSSWGQLRINATVIEEQTGIELSGKSVGPSMSSYPLNLKFEDDTDNYYKPGFPYKGRVIVKNPDGTPAPGEEIMVVFNDQDFIWSNNFTSDEAGVVHFTITDIDSSISRIYLWADAVVYESDWRYRDDEIYLRTYTPRGYSSLSKWYSPSNSYIHIPDVDAKVECDSEIMLDVYYSAEMGETYNFMSVVRAGDMLVNTNEVKIDTTTSTFDLDILSVDDSQRLIKVPRPPRPTYPPLPPLPEFIPVTEETVEVHEVNDTTEDDFEVGDDEELETVEEETIVPEVAQTLGLGDASSVSKSRKQRDTNLIGHFKLPVQVTQEMSPSVKVLVFYIKDDKEIVASTIRLDIKGCFKNKVSMTFEETTIQPGADATLNVAASPKSTCFVGMVDKSVNLLAGSNQVTPEKVFEHVQSAGRPYHYISYSKEDRDYCYEKLPPPADSVNRYYYSWYSQPSGADATEAFRDVQMWVETDFILQSRPCKEIGPVYFSNSVNVQRTGGPSQSVKIRSVFPETWLWETIVLRDEGKLSMQTTIPDTITEWVGNALCTHSEYGVGVSELTGVTAFQPFFVSLTLPYSAIRGEILPVLITVFNYLEDCLTMELRMKQTEGFQLADGSAMSRQFCLCGGNSESTKFYIVPTVIGEIDIEVTAVSIENSGLCDNVVLSQEAVGVSDGVQRQLLIEAEGVLQDLTTGAYICVEDGAFVMKKFEMSLPDSIVPDSERATVSVVGDIMGPTLSNLQNLLRMPYGCGEQNMASWSPNIYVLQYLSNTNQLTEKLEEEAEGYMRVGYQRQLKYRHNDNSYSAWGENSYGNATGSLWLTAFVVKSMAKSAPYITIAEEDMKNSADWLASKQQPDGCFPQVGHVFSSYLKGGLSGDNPAGLTAFTLIALLEANLGFQNVIQSGFTSCLNTFVVEALDTYTLSVMLYAYTLYDIASPRRADILQQLEQRKVQKDGFVYWQRETEETKEDDPYSWYRAPSAEVEMTAYVLMSRLAEGQSSLFNVQPVIQWLTKQRNPYGGFSSTQDTVVALQALAIFGSMTYSSDKSTSIEAKNSRLDHIFTVNSGNSLVYQSADVSPSDGPVEVRVSGIGCALVQLNLKYNIYREDKDGPAFDVEVNVYRSMTQSNNCHMRTLVVCASYLKSGGVSNMAIVEVKMPTGWIPEASTLQELVSSGRIQKFELDQNYVQVYFDELSRTRTCFNFDVEQEIEMNSKPSLVRVYDYYETSYSVTTEYEIKTTCGTKEEIPLDNAGLDCNVVQCRVTLETLTEKCPSCEDDLGDEQLETLTCNSNVVYKAIVGRSGEYPMKLKANIRKKSKVVLDTFATYKLDESCKCPLLTSGKEHRALIFADILIKDTKTSEVHLNKGVTIVPYNPKYERRVRQLSTHKDLCSKLQRLKRSDGQSKRSKLIRLRRKFDIS